MQITIEEVTNSKQLKSFINFPYKLYKNSPYNVPLLKFDEAGTLDKKKNPAFDYCEARYWLAYKEGKVVGRIAGILNKAYNEKWQKKYIRFGWFDFENDPAIANLLLSTVEDWAKSLQMEAVHGPLGFTDLDHQGTLVKGFNELGTLGALYNYDYYPPAIEASGYIKDVDWVEYQVKMNNVIPEKLIRIAEIVQKRLKLTVVKAKKAKEIVHFAPDIFHLINEAYSDLYGVVPLTEKQIAYYTKMYFSFIKAEFVTIITDEHGKLAAFGITMPSLSKALQKANGSLFPFGIFHLLQAMRKNNMADLYLVAIRKDLQGKGVNALIILETNKAFIKHGIEYVETNPELEDNKKVQSFWADYDARQHKRRRCYIKHLQ